MVCPARELEIEHCSDGYGYCGYHSDGVEHQRRPGSSDKVSRAREILSQSIVSSSIACFYDKDDTDSNLNSWSKQVIEHEKALKKQQEL